MKERIYKTKIFKYLVNDNTWIFHNPRYKDVAFLEEARAEEGGLKLGDIAEFLLRCAKPANPKVTKTQIEDLDFDFIMEVLNELSGGSFGKAPETSEEDKDKPKNE